MPIRIKRRDKQRDRVQPAEDTGLSAPLADDPEGCYTNRKRKFRMLCESIYKAPHILRINLIVVSPKGEDNRDA